MQIGTCPRYQLLGRVVGQSEPCISIFSYTKVANAVTVCMNIAEANKNSTMIEALHLQSYMMSSMASMVAADSSTQSVQGDEKVPKQVEVVAVRDFAVGDKRIIEGFANSIATTCSVGRGRSRGFFIRIVIVTG